MKSKSLAVGIGGLLVLAIVVVAAGAQGDTVMYHACVNNSSGIVFMVSGPDDCKPNETYVTWNQTGPQGPQGPPGVVLGLYLVMETQDVCGTACQYPFTVLCDSGDVVTGGGYQGINQSYGEEAWVTRSSPANNTLMGWDVTVRNNSGHDLTVTAYAICADLTP